MFSEYASKYIKSQRASAPLFNPGDTGDSDADDYLEAVSGSTEDDSLDSESESSSLHSESELGNTEQMGFASNAGDPPMDLLTERPKKAPGTKSKTRQKRGYSLWQQNVNTWARRGSNAGPSAPGAGASPSSAARHVLGPASGTVSGPPSGPLPRPSRLSRLDAENGRLRAKPVDSFVAACYLVSLALSLTTATLVASSSASNGSSHIYPIFVYSAKSLVLYAIIATLISIAWLYCFRHFTRAAVQISVFAVPSILAFTSLSSIVMSLHQTQVGWHGLTHAALRLSALVPLVIAAVWVLYLRHVKDVMGKAADMVVLSAEVYNQCTPAMTILTVVNGMASLCITGLWSFFLAKSFLEGKLGAILVLWLSFMYFWTWTIFNSLLVAVLAMVTGAWFVQPPASNGGSGGSGARPAEGLLSTSVYKAVTFHFSSICYSALLSMLVRFPLLVLPRRLQNALVGVASLTLSASVTKIMSPLTLPTSVLDQCSLGEAARTISSPKFTTLDYRAHRLANRLLMAGKVCCSLLVSLVAWIHADRVQDVSSVHGYLIAIVAWFIGWTIMGASENMLSMINDSLLVSYVLYPDSPRHSDVKRLLEVEPAGVEADAQRESEFSD